MKEIQAISSTFNNAVSNVGIGYIAAEQLSAQQVINIIYYK